MKKRKTGRSAGLVGTVALLALGGGAMYFGLNRGSRPAPPPVVAAPETGSPASPARTPSGDDSGSVLPTHEIQPQESAANSSGGGSAHAVAVYSVASNDEGEHLERRTLPVGAIHGGTDSDRAAAALNAMADEPHSPLPSGTHARSVKFGDDGVATVDFNKAFHENFSGGDEGEAVTINAVLATVGQFPGVRSVQILVEGQKIDSLGGNESLTTPLPIPQDILAADKPRPAAVAKSEP